MLISEMTIDKAKKIQRVFSWLPSFYLPSKYIFSPTWVDDDHDHDNEDDGDADHDHDHDEDEDDDDEDDEDEDNDDGDDDEDDEDEGRISEDLPPLRSSQGTRAMSCQVLPWYIVTLNIQTYIYGYTSMVYCYFKYTNKYLYSRDILLL